MSRVHRLAVTIATLIALVVLSPGLPALWAEAQPLDAKTVGQHVKNFELRDFRGKSYALDDLKEKRAVVVVFLGAECPLATLYAPRLEQLSARFADKEVAFVGINANQQDSISELAQYAKTHGLSFPLLKDVGNVVADQFGAQRTPEVFVLDHDRVVRYRGRIDDQYIVGRQRKKPTRDDLAEAIQEVLAGKEVSQPVIEALGCRIGRVRQASGAGEVTYSKHIAPLINARCVECHRVGEIAPFALTKYDEVAGWAETIAEVVDDNRMPPWHANPEFGHFSNDRRLSDADKQLIHDWVAAGSPEGDPKDLPAPPAFAEGWRIPRVDQVVFMSHDSVDVPAEGTVQYRYFSVDPGFKEDKWVQAAECRPGNRAIVHHILIGIRPPARHQGKRDGAVPSAWLVATAPGARPLLLGDGMAKFVPAGSKLVFQMHYTPNGSPQKDRSSVALMFADASTIKKEVGTLGVENHFLLIPPRAPNYKSESWHTFRKDTMLLSMFPHMHLRGKSFRYEVQYPDGKTEVLLDVPRYDFGWQGTYDLVEPKLLPKGTKIHCTAHYDNSPENVANPNPNRPVLYGEQTWEEMMIGYLDMTLADGGKIETEASKKPRTEEFLAKNQGQHLQPGDDLKELAAEAVKSNPAFDAFAQAVMLHAPQVDRVCLTVVKGKMIVVERNAHCAAMKRLDALRGQRFDAQQLAVTDYAIEKVQMVHPNIHDLSTPDFEMMSEFFTSSMHVPVQVDGQAATLNFWSREEDAFPPEAVELLAAIARKLGG